MLFAYIQIYIIDLNSVHYIIIHDMILLAGEPWSFGGPVRTFFSSREFRALHGTRLGKHSKRFLMNVNGYTVLSQSTHMLPLDWNMRPFQYLGLRAILSEILQWCFYFLSFGWEVQGFMSQWTQVLASVGFDL